MSRSALISSVAVKLARSHPVHQAPTPPVLHKVLREKAAARGWSVSNVVMMDAVQNKRKEMRNYLYLETAFVFFIFKNRANFFVLLAVMGLQRVFLHMFFLQDKNSPTDEDKPLALNNR